MHNQIIYSTWGVKWPLASAVTHNKNASRYRWWLSHLGLHVGEQMSLLCCRMWLVMLHLYTIYEACCVCMCVFCSMHATVTNTACWESVKQTVFYFSALIVVKMSAAHWLQAGSPIWTLKSTFQYDSQLSCRCFVCETEDIYCWLLIFTFYVWVLTMGLIHKSVLKPCVYLLEYNHQYFLTWICLYSASGHAQTMKARPSVKHKHIPFN